MLLPLLIALGLPAHAAEVTLLPNAQRGLLMLDYGVTGDVVHLLEGDTEVGARQERQHDLTLRAAFSPYQGIALALDLPVVLDQRLVWTEARQMVFDPIQGSGSMVGLGALDSLPQPQGGGLAGPTISLQLTPFNHDRFPGRVDRTTWLLEGGYRFQDKSSWWQAGDAGDNGSGRGGGPGGDAIHLRTAFSTQAATTQPYLAATFNKTFAVPVDLVDTDGSVLVSAADVQPASTLDLRAGVEIPVQQTDDHQLVVDLRGGFGYRTWQDIPSGLYLPDVLAASRQVLVTQSEALHLTGGVGMQLHLPSLFDVLLGGDAGIESPYRIEHPYGISTGGGTVIWDAQLALRLWIDAPLLGTDS